MLCEASTVILGAAVNCKTAIALSVIQVALVHAGSNIQGTYLFSQKITSRKEHLCMQEAAGVAYQALVWHSCCSLSGGTPQWNDCWHQLKVREVEGIAERSCIDREDQLGKCTASSQAAGGNRAACSLQPAWLAK